MIQCFVHSSSAPPPPLQAALPSPLPPPAATVAVSAQFAAAKRLVHKVGSGYAHRLRLCPPARQPLSPSLLVAKASVGVVAKLRLPPHDLLQGGCPVTRSVGIVIMEFAKAS